MNEEKVFWMVYCEGGHIPVRKHKNITEAYVEAERISKKMGQPSFVLEVIGGFVLPKVEPIRFRVEKDCPCIGGAFSKGIKGALR